MIPFYRPWNGGASEHEAFSKSSSAFFMAKRRNRKPLTNISDRVGCSWIGLRGGRASITGVRFVSSGQSPKSETQVYALDQLDPHTPTQPHLLLDAISQIAIRIHFLTLAHLGEDHVRVALHAGVHGVAAVVSYRLVQARDLLGGAGGDGSGCLCSSIRSWGFSRRLILGSEGGVPPEKVPCAKSGYTLLPRHHDLRLWPRTARPSDLLLRKAGHGN